MLRGSFISANSREPRGKGKGRQGVVYCPPANVSVKPRVRNDPSSAECVRSHNERLGFIPRVSAHFPACFGFGPRLGVINTEKDRLRRENRKRKEGTRDTKHNSLNRVLLSGDYTRKGHRTEEELAGCDVSIRAFFILFSFWPDGFA